MKSFRTFITVAGHMLDSIDANKLSPKAPAAERILSHPRDLTVFASISVRERKKRQNLAAPLLAECVGLHIGKRSVVLYVSPLLEAPCSTSSPRYLPYQFRTHNDNPRI